jgi:hypothetical protein
MTSTTVLAQQRQQQKDDSDIVHTIHSIGRYVSMGHPRPQGNVARFSSSLSCIF